MKSKLIILLTCLVVALIVLITSGNTAYDIVNKQKENMAIADELIGSIESYENQYQSYPTALMDLVPDYLEVLPTTTDLLNFEYRPENDTYELCFQIQNNKFNGGCCYLGRLEGWDCFRSLRNSPKE